ncbi:MAG: putative heme transporter [Pseudonocardiales bacterium]|nr:putative heme transporter [Pseudonocardiales bacterium]
MKDAEKLAVPDVLVLDTPAWRGRAIGWLTQRWRPHGRRVAIVAGGLTGIGLTVPVPAGSRDELLAAVTALARVCPGWVVAAVLAEAVCYLTRGSAMGIVLRSGTPTAAPARENSRKARKAHVSAPVLGAMTMAGDAVAYCLPFGFAAGGVVAVEQLHRRRVPTIVAGWAFAVATLLYVAVLAVLGIVAVALAGATGGANPFPGLQEAALIVLGLLLATIAIIQALRHARPGGQIARLLGPVRRLRADLRTAVHLGALSQIDSRGDAVGWIRVRRDVAAVSARAQVWWAQLHLLRLSPGAVATAAGAMLISWLADIAVLAVAFVALGLHPPWLGLLLAYCAGQIAASLPITPGGVGVVEGSLAVALVAFGGCTTGTLAAVLLYRLISHWSVIPAGALAWLVVRRPPHPRESPARPRRSAASRPGGRRPALGR